MAFLVNIGDATIQTIHSMYYEKTLNGISKFEIKIGDVSSFFKTEIDTDATVNIYKDGTLELSGEVKVRKLMQGGAISVSGFGNEVELAEQKCPMVGGAKVRTWTSTSDNTIFSALLSGSGWTANTSNSTGSTLNSFRVSNSQSIWNGIIDLIKSTGKDIYVDNSTKTLYLYDELKRSGQFKFTENINIGEIIEEKKAAEASKVEVYGKGDGDLQIYGSAGSGTPVKQIIDRNIISDTYATARATAELALIQAATTYYDFIVINPNIDVRVGDGGELNSPSLDINTNVDIVRIKRSMNDIGIEILELEVTNPAYRIAKGSLGEEIAKSDAAYDIAMSSMQGSGDTMWWANRLNSKHNYPLTITFFLPSSFIVNEAGNISVKNMTVDYDFDVYNQQFGVATYIGGDADVADDSGYKEPNVTGSSGNAAPDVSGTSATQTPATISAVSAWGSSTFINFIGSGFHSAAGGVNEYIIGTTSPVYYQTVICVILQNFTGFSQTVDFWCKFPSGTTDNSGDYSLGNGITAISFFTESDSSNTYGVFEVRDDNDKCSGWSGSLVNVYTHTHGTHDHGDGSYAAASHPHDQGSYKAGNHFHDDGTYEVPSSEFGDYEINDDVDDSASVHSTSVTIYLDFYNTSTKVWDNKHSVVSAFPVGETLNTNIDITNSGTYPDAAGFWRVRLDPNSSSADFVHGIVKIKNALDN
jgi:hypothetical protein